MMKILALAGVLLATPAVEREINISTMNNKWSRLGSEQGRTFSNTYPILKLAQFGVSQYDPNNRWITMDFSQQPGGLLVFFHNQTTAVFSNMEVHIVSGGQKFSRKSGIIAANGNFTFTIPVRMNSFQLCAFAFVRQTGQWTKVLADYVGQSGAIPLFNTATYDLVQTPARPTCR